MSAVPLTVFVDETTKEDVLRLARETGTEPGDVVAVAMALILDETMAAAVKTALVAMKARVDGRRPDGREKGAE